MSLRHRPGRHVQAGGKGSAEIIKRGGSITDINSYMCNEEKMEKWKMAVLGSDNRIVKILRRGELLAVSCFCFRLRQVA